MSKYKEEDWLIENNTLAYRILKFLMHHMDGYNTVMCSYKVLEEHFNKSTDTIRIAIKVLRENKYINIAKSGTSNVYFINKKLAWKSWGSSYKYAEFGAKIIVSESEYYK